MKLFDQLQLPGATAIIALLNGRTGHCAVGTIDATVARFGPQHLAASLAVIEPLAGIGRHYLGFNMPT